MRYNTRELTNAVNTLLKVEDGYSSADERYASTLSQYMTWNFSQAAAAHKMLSKYRRKLRDAGINFNKIPIPQRSAEELNFKKIVKASFENDRAVLTFKLYKEDSSQMLVRIQKLPGRVYDDKTGKWNAPINEYVLERLVDWGFELDKKLTEIKYALCDKPLPELDLPSDLTLFPFQEDGIKRLERWNGRSLLADEMGLGKTCQALMYAKIHPDLRPMICVVPATLKINWQRELEKWGIKGSSEIISGRKAVIPKDKDIIIINYDILKDHVEGLKEIDPKLIIADEIHLCKNPKAQRTGAFKELVKGVKHLIPISGTPIESRPMEFWTILNILDPSTFNNWYRFKSEFCGTDGKGATNMEKLHNVLTGSIMIRRLKKDVMKELPPKIRSVIPFELTNREEYDLAERDVISYIRGKDGFEASLKASAAETLVRFEKLKQLSAHGKMEQALNWIGNFIYEQKLVIGCSHTFAIDAIMERFGNVAVKYDGRDSAKKKEAAKDRFQDDEKIRLFVGNIKAAGKGITLTAASNIALLEFPWTPGEADQFEDRCHRIGTVADCVNAYYLVGMNTVDEDIVELIDEKRKVLMAIMDGEEPEEIHMVSALIEKLKKREDS